MILRIHDAGGNVMSARPQLTSSSLCTPHGCIDFSLNAPPPPHTVLPPSVTTDFCISVVGHAAEVQESSCCKAKPLMTRQRTDILLDQSTGRE